MRGKKIDKEFISSFIESSVLDGKSSLEEISNDVIRQIFLIDEKIKEAELLKLRRRKLLDVKEYLEKSL